MTTSRQPGEDLEQVYLCSAGMRICQVLPVDEEDIHAEESKDRTGCAALRSELEPAQRMSDPIEHAIDEARCTSTPKPVRQPDGLVNRDFRRDITPAQLVDTQPQNVPLHRGYPAHAPVLGGLHELRIECRYFSHHLSGQLLGPVQ